MLSQEMLMSYHHDIIALKASDLVQCWRSKVKVTSKLRFHVHLLDGKQAADDGAGDADDHVAGHPAGGDLEALHRRHHRYCWGQHPIAHDQPNPKNHLQAAFQDETVAKARSELALT